ncbi:hypothetical protein CARUB_v10003721mg, partial [Capsella rubella]
TVQPQKRKKKQSIETKATDSNAVTTFQTTSSTTTDNKLSSGIRQLNHLGKDRDEVTWIAIEVKVFVLVRYVLCS